MPNMGKTLETPKTVEIIPPPLPETDKTRANLVTLGDVRSEMGKVYNAHKRGELTSELLTKRVWALRQIGQTVEAIEKLNVGQDVPADERPMFAGLTIVSPPANKLLNGGGADPNPNQRKKTNGT